MNFSLLRRNRSLRLIYFGQFVSFIGTMITAVALPFQIYDLTHSSLMVGLLSLCQLIPLLFTALIGGVFADRYPRKLLLVGSESFLAICCLGLAVNAAQANPSLMIIFILATSMSAINGLHSPTLGSILQQIVDREDLPSLGALSTFKMSVCMIGGPAFGGLILANAGIVWTYVVDVSSFIFSTIAILAIGVLPKPMGNTSDSTWQALKEGCSYAWSRQELLGSYAVDFVAMIFGMPNALFPAIAHQYGGAKTLGLLYAAPAVGGLVVSFFSSWTEKVKHHGKAIAIAAIIWGLAIVAFGFSLQHLFFGLFFLAIAGAADAVSGIFRLVFWNETIPQTLRGRLSGIEMISYISGPRLGDTEAGFIAALFGLSASVISGGVLCVVGVIACSVGLPKFWRYYSAQNITGENI